MNKIVASKQIGDLSYFVSDLATLYTILASQKIKQSKTLEYDPKKHRKSTYISLSRNITAAALRNNKRWRYGILIDGTQLSNRYHIEPYSFVGVNNKFILKELTRYDDGQCKLRLVNWPAISISSKIFEYLENCILSHSSEFNSSHKLIVQTEGKRKINGHLIDTKYVYNVKHGDSGSILSDTDSLPEELKYLLFKSNATNEYEERIWTDTNFIDISGCIKGVILPKSELSNFETSEDKVVSLIRDLLDSMLSSYQLVYY